MKNKILIGADPEMFIQNKEEIVSAEGYIPGTKDKPFEIAKGYGLQLDNVACEFNIPPSSSFKDFKDSINFAISFIKDKLNRDNLSICNTTSTHFFDKKYLKTKNAKEFGCDPDYDVYRCCPNDAPSSVGDFRTVAGHIHIGYEGMAEVTEENSEKIVKAFDLFVVVPSILTDTDKVRRTLYGKAGAFRFKPYGVEVRALSNFWVFDETFMKMVYDGAIMATKLALQRDLSTVLEENEEKIKKAINSYDMEIAKSLIEDVIAPFYREKEELNALKTFKEYV